MGTPAKVNDPEAFAVVLLISTEFCVSVTVDPPPLADGVIVPVTLPVVAVAVKAGRFVLLPLTVTV